MPSDYNDLVGDEASFIANIKGNNDRIEYLKTSLKQAEKDLDDLESSGDVNEDKLSWDISKKIVEYCQDLHNTFRDELLEKIEKTTDKHYQDMTKTSSAAPGRIKIDYINNEIKNIYNNNIRLLVNFFIYYASNFSFRSK